MSQSSAIAWLLLTAVAGAQDLGEGESVPSSSLADVVRILQSRVEQLEAEREARNAFPPTTPIDLSGEELPSIVAPDRDHVLSRPWYENLTFSGYGAFA